MSEVRFLGKSYLVHGSDRTLAMTFLVKTATFCLAS